MLSYPDCLAYILLGPDDVMNKLISISFVKNAHGEVVISGSTSFTQVPLTAAATNAIRNFCER